MFEETENKRRIIEYSYELNEIANFEIKKIVRRMHQPQYIILSQVRNFFEKGTPIEPRIMIGSHLFTWNKWQYYFYKSIRRMNIPFHYFVEQIGNDYSIIVATPEYTPSYFLEELIAANIIAPAYRDSIVIAIKEDFSLELPFKRLYQQLCFRLLTTLQIRNAKYLNHDNILYIDKIINWDRYNEAFKNKEIKFEIIPAKFYSHKDLMMYYRKYRANINLV